MIKNRLGFTLVEVMIALGIIGVISVITIPQVMAGRQASQARAQFNSAYAVLNQAISDMESDEIVLDESKFSEDDSVYELFRSYFKIRIDCGGTGTNSNQTSCINSSAPASSGYDNYSGTTCNADKSNCSSELNTYISNGSFVLSNGVLVAFSKNEDGIFVSVDINGKDKLPNKWGWDVFTFKMVDNDLLAVGSSGTGYDAEPESLCNLGSNNTANGLTCSYFALTNDNYFRDIYGNR